jgi:LuxR family maltose regulon positive regulatory protein
MTYRNASAYAKKLFGVSEKHRDSRAEQRQDLDAPRLPLSPREIQVLTGLSQGLTREEISKASLISINTVKSVIRSVYNKLGAINRADAVRIAATMGIIKNEG